MIAGWACPYCSNKRAPLSHYAETECGLKIHPAFAAAILYDDATDPHGKEMSVTDGLGCPRLRAIENQSAELFVNPLDYNAMLLGHAWDAVVGVQYMSPALSPTFEAKVKLRGTIAGMKLTGELDNIRRLGDRLIVSDWKHSNNFRGKWIKQEGGPSMEYKIQTSIYAELYDQMFGERPDTGEVVYHFSGAGKDVLLPYQYDILPLEECLAYKPYNGQRTVLEIYQLAQQVYGEGARLWTDVPTVGMEMSFGTKDFCSYCQAKDLCFTAAQGSPF